MMMKSGWNMMGCLWVALVAVSCGGGGEGAADAGHESPDAFVQTRGEVTVTVEAGGEPVERILVLYHEPDGSPRGQVLTDETGAATLPDVAEGGSVTIVVSSGKLSHLKTYLGLSVGDAIVQRLPYSTSGTPLMSLGNITVTLPADVADMYEIQSSCLFGDVPTGAPGAAVLVPVHSRCPDPGNVAIAIYGIADDQRTLCNSGTSSVGAAITFESTMAPVTYRVSTPAVDGVGSVEFYPASPPGRGFDSLTIPGSLSSEGTGTTDFKYAAGALSQYMLRALSFPTAQPEGYSVYSAFSTRQDESGFAGSVVEIDATSRFPSLSSLTVTNDETLSVEFSADAPLECGGLGAPTMVSAVVEGIVNDKVVAYWQISAPGDVQAIVFPSLTLAEQLGLFPRASFDAINSSVEAYALGDISYEDHIGGQPADLRSVGEGGLRCMTHLETVAD